MGAGVTPPSHSSPLATVASFFIRHKELIKTVMIVAAIVAVIFASFTFFGAGLTLAALAIMLHVKSPLISMDGFRVKVPEFLLFVSIVPLLFVTATAQALDPKRVNQIFYTR